MKTTIGNIYRGDVNAEDGTVFDDCTFDHCRVTGRDLTIQHSTFDGSIDLSQCTGVLTLTDCTSINVDPVDASEDVEIRWISEMEAVIVNVKTDEITYATFTDPEQVKAFKEGWAKRK